MNKYIILAINPGSTSTQVGLFHNDQPLVCTSITHSLDQLAQDIADQVGFRRDAVGEVLHNAGLTPRNVSAVAARGGRLKPVPSGTYLVNDEMLQDAHSTIHGNHASRLAVIIGHNIAAEANCQVFVVDPISVDEMIGAARYSGTPAIVRKGLGHALNSKAVARKTAAHLKKAYVDTRLVIAHLGGGTSISAHLHGRMIDIINDFEGGFTPERCGGLPNIELVRLCFSGTYSEKDILKIIEGCGGFFGYLGTKDLREVERRIRANDELAINIMEAYIYQLTKSIGSMLAVLKYKVDAISLTGSIANSGMVTSCITDTFSPVAPVMVYPGSFELESLAQGVLRVISGQEKPLHYPQGKPIDNVIQ